MKLSELERRALIDGACIYASDTCVCQSVARASLVAMGLAEDGKDGGAKLTLAGRALKAQLASE